MTGTAPHAMTGEPRAGLCYAQQGSESMCRLKPYKTYEQQVELLRSRGMEIVDEDFAVSQLKLLNYYRLSGYWYPMRKFENEVALDEFRPEATFELAVELYNFDKDLRHGLFQELTQIELAVRALVGHHLGRIDPMIHKNPWQLNAVANQKSRKNRKRTHHEVWQQKFDEAVKKSREDFVEHHKSTYGGELPVWAAVEVMDWGMLSNLFKMAPQKVRTAIADELSLSAPQLESWLRALNVLRNYAAHHARIFNRAFDLKPKVSELDECAVMKSRGGRLFGQATMVQYLVRKLGTSNGEVLPRILRTYPHNDLVPFSRTGAPVDWENHPLWA